MIKMMMIMDDDFCLPFAISVGGSKDTPSATETISLMPQVKTGDETHGDDAYKYRCMGI